MREVKEAKAWLTAAEHLVDSEGGRERFTVAVAMSIHSIIRANDALTMRFLKRRSTRHEDAPMLFREIIKQRKIDPKHAGLRKVLEKAIPQKSFYDYRGAEVGKKEAVRWVKEAERFISTVEEILGVQRTGCNGTLKRSPQYPSLECCHPYPSFSHCPRSWICRTDNL